MTLNEYIGFLVIAIGVMLGSLLPLINALLKLNTTLNKLGHLIDVQQIQMGTVLVELKNIKDGLTNLEKDYIKHMYVKHGQHEGTE
jgi:hypothetical protein